MSLKYANADILTDSALKNKTVSVKCTYANAYFEPLVNPGLCVISYDKTKYPGGAAIGTLTGRFAIDDKSVKWYEATLVNCNRLSVGWFREMNVNVSGSAKNKSTLLKIVGAAFAAYQLIR